MANNSREAYTGNTVGRRGGVPPSSNSAPLVAKDAVGDGFNVPEARTYMDHFGEIRRDCRGHRAWHVVREASGTWEALSLPPIYRLGVGCINRKKSIRRDKGSQIIS